MSAILKGIKAAFGDVEATPYTVVVQRGGYEERVYPARRWACTTMSGPSRHALVAPMFRRLFSYISGRNEPNIRIDMTTPVTTLVEPAMDQEKTEKKSCEEKEKEGGGGGGQNTSDNTPNGTSTSSSSSSPSVYTMGFLVPASYQKNPPSSADKNIFIEFRPKMVVLARRFSGYMNDEVVQREVATLREAIRNNGEDCDVDFSRYYVAGYDPPFKLLGRRNEIWVLKTMKDYHNGCGDDDVDVVMANGAVGKEDEEEKEGVHEFMRENSNDELMLS